MTITRPERTRPEGTTRPPLPPSRWVVAAAMVVVAALLGVLFSAQPAVVFVIVLATAALPLLNARPAVWIGLSIAVPWLSRLLTTPGFAPRVLDFLDFPLVLIAFVLSVVSFLASGKLMSKATRSICLATGAAAVVMALSWGFNDRAEPMRLAAGLVLALEPFLLLIAVILAPMTGREVKRLTQLLVVLLVVQLPASLITIGLGHSVDEVKGTLLETGAGHHVSAGGLAVGFFLLVALRVRKLLVTLFAIGSLVVMIVADAKQVLFLVPFALLVLALSLQQRRGLGSTVKGILAGLVMASIAGFAIFSYQASQTAFEFIDNSVSNDTGKLAVAPAIVSDISRSPATLVFGLGPGESVSRFSFLTTPRLFKAGSPAGVLGLHDSRGADRYTAISQEGPTTGDSSFTSPQSSVLGILGDYGLAGTLAFGVLLVVIIGGLRRAPDRRLAAAALASWTLLLPLAFLFDWLEQPPFTLAVMAISGLCLRARSVDGAQDPEVRDPPTVHSPAAPDTAVAHRPHQTSSSDRGNRA